MDERKPIPFPLSTDRRLTFEEMVAYTQMREVKPAEGILVYYDEEGNIVLLNFGDVSQMQALWFGEQVRLHSLGFDIE